MSLDLDKIVDFDRLTRLFDAFHAATGIAVSIISLDGKVCTCAGWQKICSNFCHWHLDTVPACLQSEAQLNSKLMRGENPIVHHCPYGLVSGASPIVVADAHVANLFTGKFLFEPPDASAIATFKHQATKWGFDEKTFIEALLGIPIISEDRAKDILQYLKLLAEIIGEMGLNRLKLKESEHSMLNAQAALKKEIKQREDEAKKLTQILEGNPIPTFVIDADSKITHWNQACETLTGIPAADIIGTDNHQRAFYPHRRPLMADLIVKKVSTDELHKQYGGNFRGSCLIKDGYEGEAFFPKIGKWLFFTAAPIKDAKGDVIGAIETIQDTTEHRETERNLYASEARYHQLFDSANAGIFVLKDGMVVDCNQKALDLFHASREEIIGQSPMTFSQEIQPDGRSSLDEIQKRKKLVQQGVRQILDWHFLRKDGSSFDAEVSLSQSMIGEASHTLAIVRDITDRKNMFNALRNREKELDEKSRYLEKVNQALKASLDHREVEKRAVEENMLVNLKRFVFPYIEELGNCKIDTDARAYLNIIETNLNETVSRFSKSVFWKYLNLTPTEIHIADLIRNGKDSKAVAQMLGLSPSSVQWHRKNIREKLGLTNKKVNLQTYLTSLAE